MHTATINPPIVPCIRIRSTAINLQNPARYIVEKVAVVRDRKDGPAIRL